MLASGFVAVQIQLGCGEIGEGVEAKPELVVGERVDDRAKTDLPRRARGGAFRATNRVRSRKDCAVSYLGRWG